MRDFQPFEGIRPAFSYSPGLHEEGQAPEGGGGLLLGILDGGVPPIL